MSTLSGLLQQWGLEYLMGRLEVRGITNVKMLAELTESDLDELGVTDPAHRQKLLYLSKASRSAVKSVDAFVHENTPSKFRREFDKNIESEPPPPPPPPPVSASATAEQTKTVIKIDKPRDVRNRSYVQQLWPLHKRQTKLSFRKGASSLMMPVCWQMKAKMPTTRHPPWRQKQ